MAKKNIYFIKEVKPVYLSMPHASTVISEHLQNNKAPVFLKTSFTAPTAVCRFKFIILAQFLQSLKLLDI